MKMPKKNLGKFMSREDAKKILDRKERIQHPHMIKSRSHWDWDLDLGYDVEKKSNNNDENNNKT
jgi:hypothetical protein